MNSYIGIPYANRGRDRDGLDCWGLVQLWHSEQLGVCIPDYLWAYTSAEDQGSVSNAIEENKENKANWIKVSEPEYGDVLVFKIMGHPIHVGIMLEGDDFLHAFKGTQSCLERLTSLSWSRRLSEVYRWAR